MLGRGVLLQLRWYEERFYIELRLSRHPRALYIHAPYGRFSVDGVRKINALPACTDADANQRTPSRSARRIDCKINVLHGAFGFVLSCPRLNGAIAALTAACVHSVLASALLAGR